MSGKLARARTSRLFKRSDFEILMDDTISFDRACAEIADRQMRKAAASTVEALIYSLRSGIDALARNDVQERLGRTDEKQLHEICARVQSFKPHIAKPWTDDEAERLVTMWTTRHAR